MASERQIQNLIHRLEEGSWATGIKVAALSIVCLMALVVVLFDPFFWNAFKGLSHPKGMEQASIARELARGHGYTTPMLRPVEVGAWVEREEPIPALFPETYHAPLWPTVLAGPLYLFKSKWTMQPTEYVYIGDKVVAGVSILFFYASAFLFFRIIRRLFDSKVAWFATILTLLSLPLWKFSLSGLPQMFLLFLFGCALYALVRAIENQIANQSPIRWLCLTAVFFGLLGLTQAMMFWPLAGVLLFIGFYFKRPFILIPMMVAIVLAFYTPWVIRNSKVAKDPLGTSTLSILYQVRGDEASLMRSFTRPNIPSPLHFRDKIQNGFVDYTNKVVAALGSNLIAPLFFLTLLHPFRRKEVTAVKWLLLLTWLSSVFGMLVVGSDDTGHIGVANDLDFLFIPLFIAYGFAFLLVLWTRLDIRQALFRQAFLGLILVLSAIPLVTYVTAVNRLPFHWPPYSPTYISLLSQWTKEDEVIASDMPWAVSWYADRRSFWIPSSLKQFIRCHDYTLLNAPIAGVYLSPVTGNQPFLSGIVRGPYKDWAPIIMRQPSAERFPFTKALPMPFENQCVFFSDYERWADSLQSQ